MNLLRKSVISIAGIITAALLLSLTSPRTMHALGPIGAALVRITNTAEAPAIVEDVPHFASHLVTLFGNYDGGEHNYPYFSQVGPEANLLNADFLVPAGQSFVITSVEILPFTNAPAWVELYNANAGTFYEYDYWNVPGTNSTELQFPSGIVVGNGANLAMLSSGAYVTVHGYLTPN
jgi:hypothetical protein